MPYKNPEDVIKWRVENRDKAKLYRERWLAGDAGQAYLKKQQEAKLRRQAIREKVAAEQSEYLKEFSERMRIIKNDKHRRYRAKKRELAIQALGGECIVCGIDDHDVLEFDHIEPLLRKTNSHKKCKGDTYQEILSDENSIGKFQLLCANCHTKKTRMNNEYSFKGKHQ